MKKAGLLIQLLFLTVHSILFSLEESVLIGREDNWRWMNTGFSENVELQEGRHGYWDVILCEGEYMPGDNTDMLFHFNHSPVMDDAAHYDVLEGTGVVTGKMKQYGSGSAVFQRDTPIYLKPMEGALFAPGSVCNDFSIEFWLYPANLEEGETIFFWQGSDMRGNMLITQQVICTVRNRRLQWEFNNFFIPPDRTEYRITVSGRSQVVPRRWKHHLLRFNSETGLIEYLVDEVPEGVIYASKSLMEEGSVFLPSIGEFSSEPILIGENFTGFMDELRISKEFINKPFTSRYKKTGGAMLTNLFDLEYTGSRLISVTPVDSTPLESAINYYYYLTDIAVPLASPNAPGWRLLNPGESITDNGEGRFLQLMARLFPDGNGMLSPVVSEIVYEYEPDFPPTTPDEVSAVAGNGEVALSWKAVADTDLAGYLVYYGDTPGTYWGAESSLGASPIDVGNTTEITITDLTNDKLYFFSVVAYDDSLPPHHSNFSMELNARPSLVRQ